MTAYRETVCLILGTATILKTSNIRLWQPVAIRIGSWQNRPVTAHVVEEHICTIDQITRRIEVLT